MNKYRHRMAVAAHLILRDQCDQILFMRRANTGYADGQWSLPAGHIEAGETLAAACCREAHEEIGIHLDTEALTCVLLQHKHDLDGEERIDVFFAASLPDDETPTICEPEACDAMRWARLADPPAPTVHYIAEAIRAIARPGSPIINYFGF